jgi:GTP cyclohydrolase II
MTPLLARQNPSWTFSSKGAISRHDFARQKAPSTRWWNASISASSTDFSIRRSNGIARGAARKPAKPPRPILRQCRSRAAAFHLPGWQHARSQRSDCGDQLRLALALLEELGGGIILYLAQKARRHGRANKMRTYQSQDDGLDPFDANTALGFDDDERDDSIAACMLRMLGRTRIGAHQQSGQAKRSHKGRIASRMPLKAPINADNRRCRSLDFRFEEFLRTRRAHVRLGDKGYPGVDIG